MLETLNQLAANPIIMKWAGAIVLSLLGFGFMRLRRHSMKNSLAFASGILGVIVVLSLIKYFLFD